MAYIKKILDAKAKKHRPENGDWEAKDRRQRVKDGGFHALFLLAAALLIFSTVSAWSATIEGTVEIEGREDWSGVLVTIQEKLLSGITDTSGKYSIPNVPPGQYTIIAQKAGCLVELYSDFVVPNGSIMANTLRLVPGDLKMDNQINLLDRIMLTRAWGAERGKTANWDDMLDIQKDGIIDEKDRDLLLLHWKEGHSNIKLGSLEVSSEPNGATIFINGADTGKTTPYIFLGMVAGQDMNIQKYTITLELENFPPKTEEVEVREGITSVLAVPLDKEPPEFVNWAQEPSDLTEDTRGKFRILVQVVDIGGSGLGEKIPQIDYRIGTDTPYKYSSYKNMTLLSGDTWYYDIPEPAESWNAYRDKYVYYTLRAEDIAENEAISEEQSELIDDINDDPIVRIRTTFSSWERGLLTIAADASDEDGEITNVKFEYSFDNTSWTQIGPAITVTPYSVAWDTTALSQKVVDNVWIRATATDNDGTSVEDSIANTFKLDNQAPITSHDYDRAWHNQDFVIELKTEDGNGIGVANIVYILNGVEQEIEINGRSSALVLIEKEGNDNLLEYWGVDKLGNEESRKTLSGIKLDRTAPVFSDWAKDPDDLTEDAIGSFRVSVQIADDARGSGLQGKPQIDYHIGETTQYSGYRDMIASNGDLWYFDIPRPADSWNAHRGQYIYYRVKSTDLVANEDTIEQIELIDDINDPPMVKITSSFNTWERGLITIEAEASDEDGNVTGVTFEYSVGQITWKKIGPVYATPPYSASWDTTTLERAVEKEIWIRAVATDDSGTTAIDKYPESISIDNQPPVTSHNYDGFWHNEDFAINLEAKDADGIGVTGIAYSLNNGNKQETIILDGQATAIISVDILEEGLNTLEYWSVDKLGNEEAHDISLDINTLSDIKLDKSDPVFVDWTEDPVNLTEDSSGSFRISTRAIDMGESGLADKVAQFSYRIGLVAPFSNYEDMTQENTSGVWHYEIQEPIEKWNTYRGQYVYYKVKIEDVAGNLGESGERKQLIDDINDPAIVRITSTFNSWENGTLTIAAEASDIDGVIVSMRFQYSLNMVKWIPIGSLLTQPPYSIQWDTTSSIPEVAKTVWLKAIATDDDGDQVNYTLPEAESFGIDNQPPVTIHYYDGLWHRKDFFINLEAGDGNGIGVASILYRLNNGDIVSVPASNQMTVPVSITTEGSENTLEFWSVDGLGNEGAHENLSGIKLDKTVPSFSNWKQDPIDLTENTQGRFRVSVVTTDQGGSGLQGKIPQIDYHVGTDTQYDGYEPMISEDGETWYFDIPEPENTWDANRGKQVYHKVRVDDVAANVAESIEQAELIDSINDAPVVTITSIFKEWEGGQIVLSAEASDADGSIPIVQFEYSVDAVNWTPISVAIAVPPYSAIWDTTIAIPELAKPVWVKAKATDADDITVLVENIIPTSFGIDNQPPVFSDWTKVPENLTEDTRGAFRAQVNVDDGTGSKVAKVELAYRMGSLLNRTFRNMTQGSGNVWYYDIPEPIGTWDAYRGEILYYKARATDTVGNETPETPEQQELIEDINDPPRGLITSSYKAWERGTITIRADAVDDDGEVVGAQFQFSVDNVGWTDIGGMRTTKPYIVTWDSTAIIADADVWLRVMITDDDGASASAALPNSIGIDNSAPTFASWSHTELTEDSTESFFTVEVEITDLGSGLDSAQVQLDYRIGKPTSPGSYVGYRIMYPKTGDVWFYEIPRPGVWSNYAGWTLYYRVRAVDIAGNPTQSEERKEYIDPTTGSISGIITPAASWLGNAQVAAQQNGVTKKQNSVSQIDGSYSITGLRPGSYDLVVTASGYGTDRSMTNIAVSAGQESADHNVELHTYTTEYVTRSQSTTVEFRDKDFKNYILNIDRNTFGQDGKVVIGFSGREPIGVPNPRVLLMGKAIGVGFEAQSISKPLELIMPRPSGISDSKTIMTFIYDGDDYRLVDRDDIALSDSTVTITIDTGDLTSFSDSSHQFETLSGTTVFYTLITKFAEPQISSSSLGIRDPVYSLGHINSYVQPNIGIADRKVALVIHGITSGPDDMVNLLEALEDLNYYNRVLVFNYEPDNTIGSNGDYLMSELADVLPNEYGGKVDVIAHGMGGLVARRAISIGGDSYIGNLIMLATPNGGVAPFRLEDGYAAFLKKTSSETEPAWTHYTDGWKDMLGESSFLSGLNNQSGTVDTYYYSMAASNGLLSDTSNHDGLLYVASANPATFPNSEQPLAQMFEKISVGQPAEGSGFMSGTRHMAILNSSVVRNRITTYVQGSAGDIRYKRHDGDLVPGARTELTVELENVGNETVLGVSAELNTSDSYIRRSLDGPQGMEQDTATFGDIPAGTMKSGIFSFYVHSNAGSAIGHQVTFKLYITNSEDNSVFTEEFDVTLGENLIQIALYQAGPKTGEKMVVPDVDDVNPSRPSNDGDIAAEPGEIMQLSIALKNNSFNSIPAVKAMLKTTDTRVVGLVDSDEVNMSTTALEASYGNLASNGTKLAAFQFVKIIADSIDPEVPVHFTLDIYSEGTFINNEEFDVKIGADIIVTDFDPDDDLMPGPGGIEDIDVDLRNISDNTIENIEIAIDWEPNVVDDIDSDELDVDQINANGTKTVTFENVEIEEDFEGYIQFTIEIKVDGDVINIENFWHYFGKRIQYIGYWITDDDDNDDIAEPKEDIEFRMIRWNASADEVDDVEANDLNTTYIDVIANIPSNRDDSDYPDIQAYTAKDSKDSYGFTVADAGDMTVPSPSGSILTQVTAFTATLERPDATWIPDALINGLLNPNTGQLVEYTIIGNDKTTITVDTTGKVIIVSIASNGNEFEITAAGASSLNEFQLEGRTVEFTINVEENNDEMGEETISMRIGGIIRYLPPKGSSDLMGTISDAVSIDAANNGNGIPEPGETIEIDITLINTNDSIDVDNVEAELDSDDISSSDINVDKREYSKIRNEKDKTMTFQFEIDEDYEGSTITFTLEITGEIDGDEEDLGTDVFVIPVAHLKGSI